MTNEIKNLSTQTKELVTEAIIKAVESIDGYEVVEVRFFNEFGALNVTVFLWSKDGVDLNACETVHNILSPALDRYEDLFPSSYVLNVSSSGLDRPIVTKDDFRRAMGTQIEAISEGKKTHGTLKEYDDESFTLFQEKNGKSVKIQIKDTQKVQPYIRF